MEERTNINTGQGIESILLSLYTGSIPTSYRTVPIGPAPPSVEEPYADAAKTIYSRIVEIEDPRSEETYTAYVTQTPRGWKGRIPDISEANTCDGDTQEALLTALKDELQRALEERWKAWDRQLKADIEAGKLDELRKKALEDIKAGRYTRL